MPTVLVLDVSLSMSRPVLVPDSQEEYQRRHLAIHGINHLLDYMSQHCKLEFTSLVVFSYLWEQLVTFTRDFDSIKSALNKVEIFNKTCIETVLAGIRSLIVDEWSTVTPCQVILVTDGNCGIGQGSLKQSLQRECKSGDDTFPLPFPFPCKLHVVCMANPNEHDLQSSLPLYQKLIDMNGGGGEIFVPESNLSLKSVENMFHGIAERYYSPFHGTIQCGHLKCAVQLLPTPEPLIRNTPTGEEQQLVLDKDLEICGFLDIGDVASPPTISRHLVLPTSNRDRSKSGEGDGGKEGKKQGEEVEEESDDGKTPSFTVLLHGSLKVEGMVAITRVGPDWYGVMYSWADSKKKSNLMLALFYPGLDTISWLGKIDSLTHVSEFPESPYGEDDSKTPFPIRPGDKRSYAQSCVVWIKPSGLQADLQKVLRHARKLPEKQQQFYKELNRIRRAALGFGFLELLDAMASMLERECTMLPGTAHPSAAMQLSHAASALQNPSARDVSTTIMPLQTNFSTDDG